MKRKVYISVKFIERWKCSLNSNCVGKWTRQFKGTLRIKYNEQTTTTI